MIAERVSEFRRKYGISEGLARRARYLTFKELESLVDSLNLKCSLHRVWPGFRRSYEVMRARLARRRIAQFPVIKANAVVEAIYYAAAGLGWVLPAMPLMRWMSRRMCSCS